MKGKIISVLFCLMLVFGMLLASCDDGAYPEDPKDDAKKTTLDWGANSLKGKGSAVVNGAIVPSIDDLYGGDDGGDDGDDE
jgi:hypothetical protein